MPIFKLPVVQQFGIISTRYHQDFQKRLLEKTLKNEDPERKNVDHRRPLEITEEFIKQFNNADEIEEQSRMLDIARKILHRCKRRSGLSSMGSGNHVNLHLAWKELILLAQCKGRIQEDAIDILLVSLDHANFNQDHIPLLFFIAESVLYRICCDAAQKSYLCLSEVKLSKLGFLTFLRILVFHLLGKLQPYEDQKKRLSSYIQALAACESTYQPYPNILSSIHVMLTVGETICASQPLLETESSLQAQKNSTSMLNGGQEATKINPFLWQCLVIWVHVQMNSSKLLEVMQDLFLLKGGLQQENWLDSLLALFVLGEAAKLNISCLRALMELARDFITDLQCLQIQSSSFKSSVPSRSWDVAYFYSMVLADICLHGNTSEIQKHAFIGFQDKNTSLRDREKASLHGLLLFNLPQTPDDSDQVLWVIRYGAVYNLVKVCHALRSDVSRDGLRNAIWKALYKQKCTESDSRIQDAVKVAEAEVNGPTNPFNNANAKASTPVILAFSQYVGWRLASALSQYFLPPVVPFIPAPRKLVPRQLPIKLYEPKARTFAGKCIFYSTATFYNPY
ncbi:transmembrane protein 232 isoform X2 [Ascaphus truei]|uniref:transmembrane protein 232 isoform X2 n=1 Tax=Ascaphus truei TaxID=8439 RepID=UPI003F5AA28F